MKSKFEFKFRTGLSFFEWDDWEKVKLTEEEFKNLPNQYSKKPTRIKVGDGESTIFIDKSLKGEELYGISVVNDDYGTLYGYTYNGRLTNVRLLDLLLRSVAEYRGNHISEVMKVRDAIYKENKSYIMEAVTQLIGNPICKGTNSPIVEDIKYSPERTIIDLWYQGKAYGDSKEFTVIALYYFDGFVNPSDGGDNSMPDCVMVPTYSPKVNSGPSYLDCMKRRGWSNRIFFNQYSLMNRIQTDSIEFRIKVDLD